MGQAAIRRVRFLPPETSVGDIEVNTLRGIRDRGGPHEFLTPQRLDFDLLVHIESGSARHTVDFTDYALRAGDVLWVRAGQVHQWGAIADIEGPVAMFGPHTVDERTRDLIRSHLVRPRSHWSAADLAGTELLLPSGANLPAQQPGGLSGAHLSDMVLQLFNGTGSIGQLIGWMVCPCEISFPDSQP